MDFRVHAENTYVHGLRSTTKSTSLQTPNMHNVQATAHGQLNKNLYNCNGPLHTNWREVQQRDACNHHEKQM